MRIIQVVQIHLYIVSLFQFLFVLQFSNNGSSLFQEHCYPNSFCLTKQPVSVVVLFFANILLKNQTRTFFTF